MTGESPRKSKLILVGLAFLAASVLLPGTVGRWSAEATDYNTRLALAILSDLLRACFFVAIGCLIIGALRNRRWRKETQGAKRQTS